MINVGHGGHTNEVYGDLYVRSAAGTNVVNVSDAADLLAPVVSIDTHTDAGSLYTEVSFGFGKIDAADGGTASLGVAGGYEFNGSAEDYTVNGTAPDTAVTVTTNSSFSSQVDILGNSGSLTVNAARGRRCRERRRRFEHPGREPGHHQRESRCGSGFAQHQRSG